MKKIIVGIALIFIVFMSVMSTNSAKAETLYDWIIREFDTEIIVNKDSSLDITENIIADCGDLSGKHGIYRVIPYQSYGVNDEKYKTPISKVTVTDFNGKDYNFQSTNDRTNSTISLKIGDGDKTVSGVNNYRIKYHIDNVIRTQNGQFDELYWNLNGNFWELQIEKFQATVKFPDDVDLANSETYIYSGGYGQNDSSIAHYSWNKNMLSVQSDRILSPGDGITASITLPKDYFIPYEPGFWEKNALYFYLLLPLLALIFSYKLWSKYGKDPSINWTIAPEFEIPEKLAPLEFGLVLSDGMMSNTYLTAGIIALAVKGYIKISEIEKSGLFKKSDYQLDRLNADISLLSPSEKMLLNKLFSGKEQIKLSDLKDKFYTSISLIEGASLKYLEGKKWIASSSRYWMIGFIVLGMILVFSSIPMFSIDYRFALCLIAASIIIFIFSKLMRRRTYAGALLVRRLKGFELYMRKAETYRQQWLEKQNIFEEFLPYAILFGIAKEWVKKMKDIYGEEFFANYHPIWYYGLAGNFDVNAFSDTLSDMSSNISSTLSSSPSSSGSSGGGFSGGGGGGGGGGGW